MIDNNVPAYIFFTYISLLCAHTYVIPAHLIQVYPGPLEDQFDQFQDLLAIYPLSHGKGWQGDEENFVGNLKVSPTISADINLDVHVVTRQKGSGC